LNSGSKTDGQDISREGGAIRCSGRGNEVSLPEHIISFWKWLLILPVIVKVDRHNYVTFLPGGRKQGIRLDISRLVYRETKSALPQTRPTTLCCRMRCHITGDAPANTQVHRFVVLGFEI
jgi:hypothetical protein